MLAGSVALVATLPASPAPGACPVSPVAGCKLAGGAKLSIRDAVADAEDQLLWKWGKGEVLSQSELGDPITHTSYTLCLYAGAAQALVAEAPLPIGTGWKDLTSGGYGFSNTKGDGIRFVDMKPGVAGKSNVAVKGKGTALPDPPLPLAAPVTLQLIADPEPLCLQTQFAADDAAVNSATRYTAQAQASLPPPPGTIPADDACNNSGDHGSVAEQIGAQMRRSGTEWASSCLGYYGAEGSACNVGFPGNTSFFSVPEDVPSIVCPNTPACDNSLGRVEWHAEDKFGRKCTLDQWALVWGWIQNRAGAAAPPNCDVNTAAPRFWGVYTCYEEYFVHPLMVDMLNKLRNYATPNPPITPACEGALVTRLWWRLASDWIRFGNDVCTDVYHDVEVQDACGTDTPSPQMDEATLDSWCDDFRAFLRPVYEGVRAASGKPY
ncbi:MAG TPA: hypothetical protein VL049_09400 [Candidatus Dormibacteraeota bacterium]|nr:hypothetical protein [Candidatus Dormibacteraeota bacterium]